MTDLKPCPFCGKPPASEEMITDGPPIDQYGACQQIPCGWSIVCTDPACVSPCAFADDEAAAKALWNRRASQAERWRPISEAPKDGSMFLGWVDAVRSTHETGEEGRPADVSDHDFCRWRAHSEAPNGGYFENMMGQIGDMQDITHWMPLPPPPSTPDTMAQGNQEMVGE